MQQAAASKGNCSCAPPTCVELAQEGGRAVPLLLVHIGIQGGPGRLQGLLRSLHIVGLQLDCVAGAMHRHGERPQMPLHHSVPCSTPAEEPAQSPAHLQRIRQLPSMAQRRLIVQQLLPAAKRAVAAVHLQAGRYKPRQNRGWAAEQAAKGDRQNWSASVQVVCCTW